MNLKTAKEQNRSHVVEAILRLQSRAHSMKDKDRREELSRDRLKRDLIDKLRESSSSLSSSSSSSSVLDLLETTLREQDGPYGTMSSDEVNELSVCNAPGQQTSHCYCRVRGVRARRVGLVSVCGVASRTCVREYQLRISIENINREYRSRM